MDLILTNEEMRQADAYTIKHLGVPALTLMERAGAALAGQAEQMAKSGKILCLCGGGNNGGDGFVCARILLQRGREVECLLVAGKMTGACEINYQAWKNLGGVVHTEFPKKERYALIVDCLYGTGFHGAFDGQALVMDIKNSGARVLAADIPSGVNGDNGEVQGVAIKADATLCIGEKKAGVYMRDGLDYCGEVLRADIGIALPKGSEEYARLITKEYAKKLLPMRKRNSHKGSYGKAAIIAGSKAYSGAAFLSFAAELSVLGALRAGVGYATLYVPSELLPAFMLKVPECLLKSANDGGMYAFNEEKAREWLAYDAVAFGMGMGVSKDVYLGAEYLLAHYTGKLILDADGINALAEFGGERLDKLLKNKKCDVVITPHIKEFSRLTGESVQSLLDKGLNAAKAFAKRYNLTVLLKNASTVICGQNRTLLNISGNSGQAKGGSGDVLSGVLVGLCATGVSAFDAACLGAYLTGKAAELAVEQVGEYSLLATDVISYMGGAFLTLLSD